VYKTISKAENTTSCGKNKIEWTVHRLLNTDGVAGSNISKSYDIQTGIPMLFAGLETVDTKENFNTIPGHAGGKGFTDKKTIRIE
jgi:hypothetical protein